MEKKSVLCYTDCIKRPFVNLFEKQRKLDEFRKRVKEEGNTVDSFADTADLKYKVTQALKNAVECQNKDAGWVRFSDLKEFIKEKTEENVQAYKEKEKVQINAINKLQIMVQSFGEQLNVIQNNQEQLQVPTAITKEEIDRIFVTIKRPSNNIV